MNKSEIEEIFKFHISDYGKRILRFCKAVSETNPTASLDKKIHCPKDHNEIEECLLEFEQWKKGKEETT
jgi:hypothetical protein